MSDLSSLFTGDAPGISSAAQHVALWLSPVCLPLEKTHYVPSFCEDRPPPLAQSIPSCNFSVSPEALPPSSSRVHQPGRDVMDDNPSSDGDDDSGASSDAPSSNTPPPSSFATLRSEPFSDAPRRIHPISFSGYVCCSPDPVGYRQAFNRCLLQSRFTTEPVSTVFFPLLWPSLGLTPDDLAGVLGHRNKWSAPLPARTATVSPSKADPFLRFFSFLLKALVRGHTRSQMASHISGHSFPPDDPIPTHQDLIDAFQSILGCSQLEKGDTHQPGSPPRPGQPPPRGCHVASTMAPTEGAIEFAKSPKQTPASSPGLPHSIHPSRWPEAISHLGLSHFQRPRSVTPLQLLHALPALTTADLVYLAHQAFGDLSSVLDDLQRGADILLQHVLSLRKGGACGSGLAREFLSPLSCARLASFAQPLSGVRPSDLPTFVRAGLPSTFLFAIADLFELHRLGPPFKHVPALAGISPMTLRSRAVETRGGRLSPAETDTVLRLLILIGTLARVFSSPSALRAWVHGERGGLHPLSLICHSPIGLSSGLLYRFRRALLPCRPRFW